MTRRRRRSPAKQPEPKPHLIPVGFAGELAPMQLRGPFRQQIPLIVQSLKRRSQQRSR